MKKKTDIFHILELMTTPAFSVSGGIVEHVNRAASQLLLQPGMPISEILDSRLSDYEAFQEGCLFLTLNVAGFPLGASVTRTGNSDIFVIDQSEQLQLQAMALIAQVLRMPLTDALNISDRLLPELSEKADSEVQLQLAQINRRLTQINRVVLNMSDAARYTDSLTTRASLCDAVAVVSETLQKVHTLSDSTGISLSVSLPSQRVMCVVDTEKLERAIYNLLSNALKASRPGQTVEVELSLHGDKLHLTVTDHGDGIDAHTLGNVFTNYRRQPGLDSSQSGLGLGMVIVRAAAAAHNGTVLITRSEQGGTRVTMTISTRTGMDLTVRNNPLWPDYAGERNHALLELSDILPPEAFNRNQ